LEAVIKNSTEVLSFKLVYPHPTLLGPLSDVVQGDLNLLTPSLELGNKKKNPFRNLRNPNTDMFKLPVTKTATHYLKTLENTMRLPYKDNRLAG
jgi:hypothetical protein